MKRVRASVDLSDAQSFLSLLPQANAATPCAPPPLAAMSAGNIFVTGGIGYIGENVWRGALSLWEERCRFLSRVARASSRQSTRLSRHAARAPTARPRPPSRRSIRLTTPAPTGSAGGRKGCRAGRRLAAERQVRRALSRAVLSTLPLSIHPSFFPGSHTVLALLDAGHTVTIVDNLDNAFMECFDRMKELAGPEKASKMNFIKADLRDAAAIDAALGSSKFDAVIHFAGRKAVGESVSEPMLYYTHNVAGTINLIEAMRKHGVKRMVFSSSCTVYGEPQYTPLDEKHPRSAMSPYGRTKLMIEDIFNDVAPSEEGWRVILLRYFNPVGAHESGRIGEHPVGIPNNLMPFVQQVALGIRPVLNVFGTDYPTRDGTCIRDYIHVSDLAVS